MITLPDRLTALAGRIENGETVTAEELHRVAALQAIDLAVMGRQFVEDAVQRDKEADDAIATHFGAQPR